MEQFGYLTDGIHKNRLLSEKYKFGINLKLSLSIKAIVAQERGTVKRRKSQKKRDANASRLKMRFAEFARKSENYIMKKVTVRTETVNDMPE